MRHKITTRVVQRLQPRENPYEVVDTDLKGFLLRVQPSGKKVYYFSYRNQEGKRNRFRIGNQESLSPTQARDAAKKLAYEVARGRDIQSERKLARDQAKTQILTTLQGFLDGQYEPWLMGQSRDAKAEITRMKRNFDDLLSKDLADIHAWHIEKWRSSRLKSGISRTTVNRDIAPLRAALNRAFSWGHLESNPLASVKSLKIDSSPQVRFLSESEENRLRKSLRDRDQCLKAQRRRYNHWRSDRNLPSLPNIGNHSFADYLEPIILISLNTGIRKGEALSLLWENIDLSRKILTVVGVGSKSGNTRHIPLNSETYQVLRDWQSVTSSKGLVFPNRQGRSLTSIKTAWQALRIKAGLKNFRWHDLRHNFASKLAMAGIPLNTIRELMGHAGITMTLRYAHLAPDHKAEAVETLKNCRNLKQIV